MSLHDVITSAFLVDRMDVLVEEGILVVGILEGGLDGDVLVHGDHSNRSQEEVDRTCAVGKHSHDGVDRVEGLDALRASEAAYLRAYAFRVRACGHKDLPLVVASLRLHLRLLLRPSQQDSCRYACQLPVHSTVSLP